MRHAFWNGIEVLYTGDVKLIEESRNYAFVRFFSVDERNIRKKTEPNETKRNIIYR